MNGIIGIKGFQKIPIEQRFFEKVKKTETCWIWTACTDQSGYGVIQFHQRPEKAHRVSWMMFNGEIPVGKYVLHNCDTPACVNPAHLFVGTQFDNMHDMAKKGRKRNSNRTGELNASAKLTEGQVLAIRKKLATGSTTASLVAEYGVSQSLIDMIKRRARWKHI